MSDPGETGHTKGDHETWKKKNGFNDRAREVLSPLDYIGVL